MIKKGIILALLLCGLAFAGPPTGFAGIPFGTPKTQVVEILMKRGLDPQSRANDPTVEVPRYMFGDMPVAVSLRFNGKDQLTAFQMRTGGVSAERFFKVIEAAKYMSARFSSQYGNPTKVYHPRMAEVSPVTFYRLWDFESVGLAVRLQRRRVDGLYHISGDAVHRKLSTIK